MTRYKFAFQTYCLSSGLSLSQIQVTHYASVDFVFYVILFFQSNETCYHLGDVQKEIKLMDLKRSIFYLRNYQNQLDFLGVYRLVILFKR